jgi:hypothetical protein
MAPTLVLLAAGMSTRYGRLKQLEPLGPGGEALLDFSVHDARRAGFGRILLIIREELEEAFRDHVQGRWPAELQVVYHHQRLDDLAGVELPEELQAAVGGLVAERRKPWGTAHALLTARHLLPEPFAILNADDFYGEPAFLKASALLGQGHSLEKGITPTFALMGYTLADTLFGTGGVSRGICRVSQGGWLEEIEEVLDITEGTNGIVGSTVPGKGVILNGQEPISTNFWIFTPAIFPLLGKGFLAFLVRELTEPREEAREGEFLIPTEVNRMVAGGAARVRVLEAGGPFFGITHPEDRDRVMEGLRGLTGNGHYPNHLWGSRPRRSE